MNSPFPHSYRVIAYSLCWVMSVQPAMAKVQPGNANTQVIAAGNGVPVVNIARPNDKGLSHNQYQQFNVDKQGLILNNATNKLTQTQLGGLIRNNPNLNGKGASVILNEVTGANRSQLNGYTEVAGDKANVIVTNPYGITCNGCGFINTPRVTLSTGNPQITNGEVSGFNVNQGDIIIDGQGLDATKQDYLDLISRSAKIQANIHANQLNVIAGSNEVEYKTNRIHSTKQNTASAPKVAIDSSALGGMYAGRIALVSTEHGVGVNVGNVATTTGGMTLTSEGKIVLGNVSTAQDLVVKTSQEVALHDTQHAGTKVQIEADSIQANQAYTAAVNQVDLNANHIDVTNSQVVAGIDKNHKQVDGGQVNIKAKTLSAIQGQIFASKDIEITATDSKLIASQMMANNDISLSGENLNLDKDSQLIADNDVKIAQSALQQAGTVAAKNTVAINTQSLQQSGVTQANVIAINTGDATLSQDAVLSSQGDLQIQASQSLENAGVIASEKALTIDTANAQLANTSSLLSNGNIDVNVDNQLTQSGELVSQGNMDVTANDIIISNTANLAALGNVSIDAQNQLEQHGSVAAQGQIATSSDRYSQSGQMVSGGDIQLTANQITLTESAQLASQANLNLTAADTLVQNGQLAANQDINIDSQTLSQSGDIQANQNLNITAQQVTQSATGVMQSGQDLNLSGVSLTNHGVMYSGNNQQLTLQSQFSNMGQLLSQAALELNAQNIQQKGTLNANSGMALSANRLTIQGDTQSSGNLNLTANQMNLQHDVLAGGDLTLDSKQNLSLNRRLQAGNNLNITTQGQLTNRGQLVANNQLLLEVLNTFNNLDSGVVSSHNLGISASNITNQGLMQAQSGLALDSQNNITNQGTLVSMGDAHLQAKNNLSNSALIYADNDAFLLANNTISNTDADILTGRDLMFSNLAGGRAKKWVNTSGNVESGRDLAIYADEVLNKRHSIKETHSNVTTNYEGVVAISISVFGHYDGCSYSLSGKKCRYQYDAVDQKELTSQDITQVTVVGNASHLRSQGNMLIDTNNLINEASQIAANKDLTIKANQVNNLSYSDVTINHYNNYHLNAGSFNSSGKDKPGKYRDQTAYLNEQFTETLVGNIYNSSIQAGNKLTITASGNVDNTQQGVHFTANDDKASMQNTNNQQLAEVDTRSSDLIDGPNVDDGSAGVPDINLPNTSGIDYPLPKNDKGLFVFTPDVGSHYLIETNPALTNMDEFLGSGYLFDQIGYNPNKDIKMLGDAFYDTRFISQSIFEQTGQMYLSRSIGSDIEQMQSLLDNATLEANNLHLQAGVALTPEQVASLTRDIVWWESTEVNGQTVLAPKLYLSQATLANVKNGALIGGDEIAISAGNINNSGSIDSSGNMTLVSQNAINNNGGLLQATDNMLLQAMNDINNIGAKIKGGNIALISGQGSINNLTETSTTQLSDERGNRFHGTNLGQTASIEASQDLLASAGKDINIHASQVSAGGSAALQAGDNINITSANDTSHTKGHNMEKRHVEVVSSTVSTGEHLALDAEKDITVIGSQLNAGGDAALKAKGDIMLQAQTNSDYSYLKTKEKKSFGRSKTTITETQTESTVGADITSGGNLTLQAQKLGDTQLAGGTSSINVIGSELKSGGDVRLSADGDITLAAHETQTYDHKEVHKSGFGGLSKKQKGSIDYATQLTGSDVVGAGTVLINSGNDINLIASGVEAGKDASLTAMNQVLIDAGQITESHQSWSKSSSFLSGGSLFTMETIKDSSTDIKAQSSNINAQGNVTVQSGNAKVIGSDIHAQGNILLLADTGDVQILAAEESHSSSHKSEKLDIGFGDMIKNLTPQGLIDNLKESTKNGQIKITIADATYNAVDSSIERTTHQGANIIAGGDVTVNADNDINIAGSKVIAGNSDDTIHTSKGDINLSAGNNITIAEVNDTEHSKTKETHGEASVSVKVQHQAVEVAKMVKATEEARKQAEQAQKDYKQYKKQLDSLESTLDDLQTQLANHEPGVTKQDILELKNIIEDTKSDEAWYLSNIALSGANLASKITLLAKQTAAAAQSSSTYGFDVGLEANVAASTSKNETMSSTAQGSTLAGNNIYIQAGQDATIQGSQVLAQDELSLNADNVNILASKDTHFTQSSSERGSITVSTSLHEASSGFGVDMNLSNNAAISNSTSYNNNVLVGDNVNITTSNDTTIKGGNVIANNGLNVDIGGDLTVESLQNRDTASNHGMSISAGIGSKDGNLSGANGGFNQSQGRNSQTDTVISNLVSNGEANINVKGNTDLTGSTIVTLDENGNDSGKLALNTGSLTFTDLSDTSYSSHNNNGVNTSVGINATGIDATNNSSTLNLDNGSHYSKDKTLATLGNGDIQIGDGTVLAPELNRDIHNQDKELFAVDRQQGNVDVTVDHRLLTEEGRQGIKEDFKRNDIVIDSIVEATQDETGVSFIGNDDDKTRGIWETQANKQDFFTATKNFVADPNNAQYVQTLNDPNASLEQKQQAQQVLVNNIAAQMKVDPAVVLQAMTTDEKDTPTKGGYINGGDTLYVNGGLHNTIQDEANTVGHEMQHYLDDKAGTVATSDTAKQNLEHFADTMGNATEDFLGFNYGNLTDTTFGGDINHTASTNMPGGGVLLDNNTNQFNQTKEHGELENRFLTPADISKAQELAKNSNGKFSVEEIKDALRHTIADDGEEYPDGMTANLIDVYQLAPELASQIDGSNGHLIVAQGEDGQGRYIVQDMSQIPLDGDVKQYIENSGLGYEFYELQPQQNGMGEYDWLTGKPLDTNGQYVISHAVEGKQYNVSYMPCATADCIASNANMKYSADYEKAKGAKALSDVSTMANGVILLTPAGPVAYGALNGGKIAVGVSGYIGLTSGIGTAVLKDEIVKSSVKEGGSRLSQVALKELAGKLAAGKLDALIGVSGFYDKSVEQIPNDNILKKDIFGDESK